MAALEERRVTPACVMRMPGPLDEHGAGVVVLLDDEANADGTVSPTPDAVKREVFKSDIGDLKVGMILGIGKAPGVGAV